MNTTAGFTWSAMDTKASPKSATAFGTTTGVRGALRAARLPRAWGRTAAGAARRRVARRPRGRICRPQLVQRPGDLVRLPRAEGLLRALDRLVESGLEGGVELVDPLLRVLLHLIHHRVEPVAALDLLATPLVFGRMRLGFLHHLVDVLVAQTRRGLDPDLLLLAGGLVARR